MEKNEKPVYYWLNDREQFGKYVNDDYYLLQNGEWIIDSNRIILGKLIGYDEFEPDDSPYKSGSTSELNTIEHLTEEEFIEQYHDYLLRNYKEQMSESLGDFTDKSSEKIDYFNWTVSQIDDYLEETNLKTLADIYEAVYKRWVIEEDNTFNYEEGTAEYAKAIETFNEWDYLRDKLEDTIVQIVLWLVPDLKEEEKYTLINTFMNKNGYEERSGWWVKTDDMD